MLLLSTSLLTNEMGVVFQNTFHKTEWSPLFPLSADGMPTTPDLFLLRLSNVSQVLWQHQGGTRGADHPFADLESSTPSFTGVQRA